MNAVPPSLHLFAALSDAAALTEARRALPQARLLRIRSGSSDELANVAAALHDSNGPVAVALDADVAAEHAALHLGALLADAPARPTVHATVPLAEVVAQLDGRGTVPAETVLDRIESADELTVPGWRPASARPASGGAELRAAAWDADLPTVAGGAHLPPVTGDADLATMACDAVRQTAAHGAAGGVAPREDQPSQHLEAERALVLVRRLVPGGRLRGEPMSLSGRERGAPAWAQIASSGRRTGLDATGLGHVHLTDPRPFHPERLLHALGEGLAADRVGRIAAVRGVARVATRPGALIEFAGLGEELHLGLLGAHDDSPAGHELVVLGWELQPAALERALLDAVLSSEELLAGPRGWSELVDRLPLEARSQR